MRVSAVWGCDVASSGYAVALRVGWILVLAVLALTGDGVRLASRAANLHAQPLESVTRARSRSASAFDDSWVGYPVPSVSSQIHAILPYAGGIVMGGDGSFYGTTTCQKLALWDGQDWQALGDGVPLSVYSLSVYGSSLVACGFQSPSAVERPAIFLWDGATWTTIGNASGGVFASAVIGTDLFVGGTFQSINGVPASRIARWDGSTWHAVGAGFPGSVSALVVHGGVLVAGGSLGSYQGVAQWDGANWSTIGPGLQNGAGPGSVSSLGSDGVALYASGTFDSSGGTPVTSRVVAWNGVSWSGIPGPTQSSAALAVYGGFPMATVHVGGVPRPQLWNGSAWQAFNLPNVNPQAYGLDGSNLYVGGFLSVNWPSESPTINPIHRFDGTNWTPVHQPWTPEMKGIAGGAFAVEALNGSLFAGVSGPYFAVGDHFLRSTGCARWDGTNWNAAPAANTVSDLAIWQDSLVAATFNGPQVWNGTNWRTLSSGTGSAYAFSEGANGFAVCGNDLLMLGVQSVGSTVLNGVGQWDGYGWVPVGGGVSPYYRAYCGTRWNSDVVLGGAFTSAGGTPLRGLARWDGVSYHDLGGGVNSNVLSMLEYEGDLLVCGSFTEVGGDSIRGVARWDGSSWSALGNRAVSVTQLRVHDGTLYASGEFLDDEGLSVVTVCRWSGAEWQLLGSGLGRIANLTDFTFLGDDLYIVGGFNEANGHAARGFAKLPNAGTVGVSPPTSAGARLLLAPSPNPSRGAMRFSVTLPEAGRVRLVIHDVSGREVARLLDGTREAGTHSLAWDAHVAPGLYFATLEGGGMRTTTRVARLK